MRDRKYVIIYININITMSSDQDIPAWSGLTGSQTPDKDVSLSIAGQERVLAILTLFFITSKLTEISRGFT